MVEYRSPKPLVRVRILVPLLEHLRELRCFFYVASEGTQMLFLCKEKNQRKVLDNGQFYNFFAI